MYREDVIKVGEVTLCVFEWSGAGPPLVLLHGAGQNALWWNQFANALPERRIVAVDMPGHGMSSPATEWNLEAIAELLFEGLRPRLPGSAVWGGQSWGGKVAALVAATRRQECAGLLLIDPSPAQGISVDVEQFVGASFGRELGPWPSVEVATKEVASLAQYRIWSDPLKLAFERGLTRTEEGDWRACVSRQTLASCTETTLLIDHSHVLANLSPPTLLIVAGDSLAWQRPTNMSLLPTAELRVVQGSHWLHVQRATEIAALASSWL